LKQITSGIESALAALKFIIPILAKYKFRWVITGGFAALAYGVNRPLTDIDIDIATSKDAPEFTEFLKDIGPYITQKLEHFVDQNYDNFTVEFVYGGQLVDVCPMAELKIFEKSSGTYELFYKEGFPETELVNFHSIELPLLSKELIIKNKEMLVWQREADKTDIEGLRKLLD
jgi:hypothetical protein